MVEQFKEIIYKEILAGNWVIIRRSSRIPRSIRNKEIQLMYEDDEGYPQTCRAVCVKEKHRTGFRRISDNFDIRKCIAWRVL